MNLSYEEASARPLAGENTVRNLFPRAHTDDSILAPDLRAKGFHTMTLFGLDAPWSLFARDNEKARREAEQNTWPA